LIYKDSVSPHLSISTLPGMFERTISIGSVGKTFSVTVLPLSLSLSLRPFPPLTPFDLTLLCPQGWKIGWAIAPADLVKSIWMVHQFNAFSVSTPLQEATAIAFEQAASHQYFENFMKDLERRRNLLGSVLDEVGLKPTIPDGSYFIMAETSACKVPATFQDRRRDYNFCRWLTSEVGVAAIPPSAFYDSANEHLPGNYARFCFIKSDEMLDEAARRLRRYFLKK